MGAAPHAQSCYLQAWMEGVWLPRPQNFPAACRALAVVLAREQLHPGPISPQQSAPGPIDHSPHAADEYGSSAHCTRLQGDIQGGLLQVPPAQTLGSRLQCTLETVSTDVQSCPYLGSWLSDPPKGTISPPWHIHARTPSHRDSFAYMCRAASCNLLVHESLSQWQLRAL